jgi:hypothetical protein
LFITMPNESKKPSLLPTFPHILWTGKTQGILADAWIRWTLRSYPVGKIIAVNRTDWRRLDGIVRQKRLIAQPVLHGALPRAM